MPVLQYLRNHMRLWNCKGCGRRLRVLYGCQPNGIKTNQRLYAVNACLMLLGMMDGKHLITIEGIEQNGKTSCARSPTDSPSGIIIRLRSI